MLVLLACNRGYQFDPASLPTECHHFLFTPGVGNISLYKHCLSANIETTWKNLPVDKRTSLSFQSILDEEYFYKVCTREKSLMRTPVVKVLKLFFYFIDPVSE